MPTRDPFSVAGATLPIEERVPLLVIGAGHAGLAAALAAAEAGTRVMLVDENPVPAETMADDIPHFFGARMTAAARNRTAMLEAFVASSPALERAFDAGVDIRLGTVCWGLYANGPSVGWMAGPLAGGESSLPPAAGESSLSPAAGESSPPLAAGESSPPLAAGESSPIVAGLADSTRSWLVAADRVIVAAGRRDMSLAFDGWARPGVMGMEAATLLAARYGALDVRRAVILGTTAEAQAGAATLAAAGVTIVAMVEPGPAPLHPTPFPTLCRHTVRRAEGGPLGTGDGVTALVLDGPDGERHLACDAVILAVGTIPLIELLDSATCRTGFDPARGGHVPLLDAAGRTTVPGILAAGDCAGIWPAKSQDPAIAATEGRRAALGQPGPPAPEPAHDLAAYRLDWVRSTVLAARTDPHVCQCEEVTAREILEVRPPRYLDAPPDRRNARELASLLGNGPPSPDQVKRLTRAGMGVCQGRRCRDQVAALLALASGLPLGDIPLATHRAPVRPLPLRLGAPTAEDAGIAAHWDVWFGMPSQYRSFWDLPARYTAAGRGRPTQPE